MLFPKSLVIALATLASTLQLRDSYDFVIAGGGTAGLTLADRLTEAFPKKTVLVIEYGQIEFAVGVFDPPQIVWGSQNPLGASSWIFNTLPNAAVKDRAGFVVAGKVVGGSSAVNGMFFDRGSRLDYDAWRKVGGPEFDSSPAHRRWDWDGIFPFFKKSVTFTAPSPAATQQHGYTWDISAYGGTTPIHSSFPPFQWGDHPILRGAWTDMGVQPRRECAGGNKEGLCWIPISQHPVTARRSHAGLGHYAAVNETRPNYHLLVRHQVIRVTYPKGLEKGPPRVEVRSLADNSLFNITAKAEVILSAGAFHTPTILQRSGIGLPSFLQAAGIPVVLDLPGVGSNLQDHSGPAISWNYTNPLPSTFSPLPSAMLNLSFASDALAGFDETPARGPYTLAMANSAAFLSLPKMTPNYTAIIAKIHAMVSDGSAASYLPADLRSDPTIVAGYKRQLLVTADLLANPDAPSVEVPWATGTAARLIHLHSLSRGTVRLNLTHPLEQPILDYRTAANPVDFDIHLAHLRYMRGMYNTPTMQQVGAVELTPSPSLQTDEALINYIKDQMVFSFMHPCCTAAMMPRAKGGVVGPDLRVHGADGLRVVDMSILPLVPSSHLSATAYAVGEKAADIIIREWSAHWR